MTMKSLQPLSIQTTSNHTEPSMQEEKEKVEEVEEEGQEIELPEEASEDAPAMETKEEEKPEEEVKESEKEETDELDNYSDSVKKRIHQSFDEIIDKLKFDTQAYEVFRRW